MELRDVLSSLNDDELIEVISDAAAELSASDAAGEKLLDEVYDNVSTTASNNFVIQHIHDVDSEDVLDEFEPEDIIEYLNARYDYTFEA